jgi:hypothetical protein
VPHMHIHTRAHARAHTHTHIQSTPNVNEQKIAEEKFREIAVAYQVST